MSKKQRNKSTKTSGIIPLKELIPSKNVRKYHEKRGWSIGGDRTIANIIWNHDLLSRSKKLKYLKALCDTTKDKVLKTEIQQRLDYEYDTERLFKTNDGSCVYQVTHIDDDNDELGTITCSRFEIAQAFAKRWGSRVEVKKMCIIDSAPNKDGLLPFDTLPLSQSDEMICKYFDDRVSSLHDETFLEKGEAGLTKKGEISWLWDDESTYDNPTPDGRNFIDFMPTRFEMQFYDLSLPDEFKHDGAIVKILRTGEIGVLCAKGSPLVEINFHEAYLDYSDVQVMVMIPCPKDGKFTHDHINPLFLQTVVPINNGDIEHDTKVAMVKKLSAEMKADAQAPKMKEFDAWDMA